VHEVRGAMSVIGSELRNSKDAMSDVFANAAMRRIFAAFAVSLVGDGVFALSAAVYVYRHGGATAVGALTFVRYVLIALIAPLTSTLADQYDRKKVMVAADLVRLTLISIAALIVGMGYSQWALYAVIILSGLAGTAFRPAQASILPLLAHKKDEIAGANVVSSTIESVGFFAGPALAGLLLAYTNITTAFIFDAATFVWSASLVWFIRVPRDDERTSEVRELISSPNESAKAQSFLVRAEQGFRTIWHDRDVMTIVNLYILQCVVAGASAVFDVAVALKLLHVGNSGFGLIESMLGVGGLVGGFIALVLVGRCRLAIDFGVGVMIWAAPLLIIAIFPNLAAVLITMWLIGAANSVVDVNAITILQHIVPNDRLGRVLGALEAGEVAGMALGALAMTLLIHVVGLRLGLALIGSVITLAVIPGLPALQRIDKKAFADGLAQPVTSMHAHHHLHLRRHRLIR
jgi:MFS family permease